MTSSDGVLWTLSLAAGGKDLFRGVHHFTQVGVSCDEDQAAGDFEDEFPEDEFDEVAGIKKFDPELQFLWDNEEETRLSRQYAEEAASSNPVLEEYNDYGVTLPTDIIREITRQSEGRAIHTALFAHGLQIVDALERFGFDFDRESMSVLLTTGPLTASEMESDLGNLPRFLKMLGVLGVFDDESEHDEAAFEENQSNALSSDWSALEPGKLFEQVMPITDVCSLEDIADEPIRLTFVQVAQLHLMSSLCCREDQPVAAVLEFAEAETSPAVAWQELNAIEACHEQATWRLCFEPRDWWFAIEEQCEFDAHEFVECLRSLPVGTHIELSFMVQGLSEKCHRYSGRIDEGTFMLEQTYPTITMALLREALTHMELVTGPGAIDLRTPEEEAAVRSDYQKATQGVARIRNGKIKLEYGERDVVVRTLLFERFRDRGPWDIEGAEQQIAEGWQQYESLLVPANEAPSHSEQGGPQGDQEMHKFLDMMQQFEDTKVVPCSNKTVFKGKAARFFQASMADIEHVSVESLAQDDAAMASFGFRKVADMVADIDPQELTRCYAGPASAIALLGHRNADNSFGLAHEGRTSTLLDLSGGLHEFHTHFEDGSTLVTNDNGGATSSSDRGIYVRTNEDLPVGKLWNKHIDGISRFNSHRKTVPVDHSHCTTPRRFAALVDELLVRFTADN